jgi:hypothetical protein
MSRVITSFTLSPDVLAALDQRSKETGEKKSRIVEQGIRLALALPLPEKDEERGPAHAPTRTEIAVKTQLQKLAAHGFCLPWEICVAIGGTSGPVNKALRALEMRGEAFCWGAGRELGDGTFEMAWGVKSPQETVRQLIETYKARGGTPYVPMKTPADWPGLKLANLVEKLARVCDDVEQINRMISEALDLDLNYQNTRQIVAALNERERQRAAEFAAGLR